MSTDKGYTKIPNKIIEAAIRYDLTSLEWVALMYVIRKTYGWRKESDTISVRKIANDTGHDARALRRAVGKLVSKGIVTVTSHGAGKINSMRINDPVRWDKLRVRRPGVSEPSPGGQATLTGGGQSALTTEGQATPHKRKKDTIKETITKESVFVPENERTPFTDEELREMGWLNE